MELSFDGHGVLPLPLEIVVTLVDRADRGGER